MSHQTTERLTIPTAIVIAAIIIGASLYMSAREIARGGASAPGQATQNVAAAPTPIKLTPITSQDHIRGTMNAKVTIVEYSDLECPFCKQYHAAIKEALAGYPAGTVAWVYRHFPLSIHPKAQKEAEATECAAAQGGNEAFWKFVDRVFEVTPSNNKLDEAQLPVIAREIGLNVQTFQTCLNSGTYKAKVDAQAKSGATAGVTGTPMTFVVSKKGPVGVRGAASAQTLKARIDEALEK
ncbi:MAG TPA: DsbA family protein [Candidatus Paceibacterota bacterium]